MSDYTQPPPTNAGSARPPTDRDLMIRYRMALESIAATFAAGNEGKGMKLTAEVALFRKGVVE